MRKIRGQRFRKIGIKSAITSQKKIHCRAGRAMDFYDPTWLKDGQQHPSRSCSIRLSVNGETNRRDCTREDDIALPLSKKLHAALCMESRACQQFFFFKILRQN